VSRPSDERRQSRRMRLTSSDGALEISLDGSVLDISVSGMAIEIQGRLAPRRPITLRLHHPDEVVKIDGRVVWCFLQGTKSDGHGESRPLYRAGIQFENILQPAAKKLASFLASHAIVSSETRLFGRFHVPDDGGVDMTSEADFRVVMQSERGLTVETMLALEPRPGTAVDLRFSEPDVHGRAQVISSRRQLPTDNSPFEIELEWLSLNEVSRVALAGMNRAGSGPDGASGGD
jgi:hypothetical protein